MATRCLSEFYLNKLGTMRWLRDQKSFLKNAKLIGKAKVVTEQTGRVTAQSESPGERRPERRRAGAYRRCTATAGRVSVTLSLRLSRE